MQKAKETATNIAASAKAGMDKTKAVVQEKVEKMTAHDPIEKDMATQRKEDKITQAEINKQQTREHNAAATGHTAGVPGTGGTYTHSVAGTHGHGHLSGLTGTGGETYTHSATGTHGHLPGMTGTGESYTHSATGAHGLSTGMHQMSALPGHGTGHTVGGHVVEGTVGSHPIGKATGTGGTAAHNTQAGVNPGTNPTGYGTGTGGTYS